MTNDEALSLKVFKYKVSDIKIDLLYRSNSAKEEIAIDLVKKAFERAMKDKTRIVDKSFIPEKLYDRYINDLRPYIEKVIKAVNAANQNVEIVIICTEKEWINIEFRKKCETTIA